MKIKSILLASSCLLLASCGGSEVNSSTLDASSQGETSSVATSEATSEETSEATSEEESSVDSYELSTISPAGAPALAYWQYAGSSSFLTDATTTNVSGQFNTTAYDAVVFDSINALRVIKNNSYSFKLARFLTGGNFYVVSYGKDASAVPTSSDTWCSFNEAGLPNLVFQKLLSSYEGYSSWEVGDSITYFSGVSYVSQALIAGTYDYYFIAQPALQAALTQLGENASKVNIVANLRADWEAYSGQTSIPQAAVFIRNSTVEEHPAAVSAYLDGLDEAIDAAISSPSTFKNYITANTSDNGVTQFGFNANVAYAVQSSTSTPNGFGLIAKDSLGVSNLEFTNNFIEKLENESYTAVDSSLFLNL